MDLLHIGEGVDGFRAGGQVDGCRILGHVARPIPVQSLFKRGTIRRIDEYLDLALRVDDEGDQGVHELMLAGIVVAIESTSLHRSFRAKLDRDRLQDSLLIRLLGLYG